MILVRGTVPRKGRFVVSGLLRLWSFCGPPAALSATWPPKGEVGR